MTKLKSDRHLKIFFYRLAVGLVMYWTKKKKVRVPPNGWTSGEKKVHSFYRVKSGNRLNEAQRHNIYFFLCLFVFFTFF